MNKSQIISRSLIIACGNAPVMFNSIKESLNLVTVFVQILIYLPFFLTVTARWNHYFSAIFLNTVDKFIAIICLIRYHGVGVIIVDKIISLINVSTLTRSKNEKERIA